MAAAAGNPPAPSHTPAHPALARIRAALAPTLTPAQGAQEDPTTGKQAAVALVLREAAPVSEPSSQRFQAAWDGRMARGGGDAELLLIRRAERTDDPWSGQMALPGGRKDPADPSVLHTAVRETYEEVGLQLDVGARLVGRLPPLPALARGRLVGMTVMPFVFQLDGDATLRTNHEVAEALWVPLSGLSSGAWDTFVDYPIRGSVTASARLPAWSVEGRIVWGLTHRMIVTFLDLLEHDLTAARREPSPEGSSR